MLSADDIAQFRPGQVENQQNDVLFCLLIRSHKHCFQTLMFRLFSICFSTTQCINLQSYGLSLLQKSLLLVWNFPGFVSVSRFTVFWFLLSFQSFWFVSKQYFAISSNITWVKSRPDNKDTWKDINKIKSYIK